jgi:hypothetical protein
MIRGRLCHAQSQSVLALLRRDVDGIREATMSGSQRMHSAVGG